MLGKISWEYLKQTKQNAQPTATAVKMGEKCMKKAAEKQQMEPTKLNPMEKKARREKKSAEKSSRKEKHTHTT